MKTVLVNFVNFCNVLLYKVTKISHASEVCWDFFSPPGKKKLLLPSAETAVLFGSFCGHFHLTRTTQQ